MLKKANISPIKMFRSDFGYNELWKKERLGKFTSSRFGCLCAPEGIGKGGTSYIYDKIGEDLSGKESDPHVDTDATRWGAKYEEEAIWKFKQHKEIENYICTQTLITAPGSRFGSTPDFLIPIRESTDGKEIEVKTGEVKCPPSFKHFIELSFCETPQHVKKIDSGYYWQTISQMVECDAQEGYFIAYHPLFRAGNLTVIEFKALQYVKEGKEFFFPIKKDLDLLKERKRITEEKFLEYRDKMIAKGYV